MSELKKHTGILLFFKYYGHLIWKIVIKLLSSCNDDKRFSAGLPNKKAFFKYISMLL